MNDIISFSPGIRSGGYEYISEEKLYWEMIRVLSERYIRDEIDFDRFLELKENIDEMFSE